MGTLSNGDIPSFEIQMGDMDNPPYRALLADTTHCSLPNLYVLLLSYCCLHLLLLLLLLLFLLLLLLPCLVLLLLFWLLLLLQLTQAEMPTAT